MSESPQDSAFDQAAEAIFQAIPQEVRDTHKNELVFIHPSADPSQQPPYVFGRTLGDVLRLADARFGPKARGELMSLATEDGSVPEEVLDAMRCVY